MRQKFTLDEIYGLSLDEYCYALGVDIDSLIDKNQKEIQILKERLYTLVWGETNKTFRKENELIEEIQKYISKKEKHLKRLKNWKNK